MLSYPWQEMGLSRAAQALVPTWSSSPMRSTGKLEYSTLYRVINQSSYAVCKGKIEAVCHAQRQTAGLPFHAGLSLAKWEPYLEEKAPLSYPCTSLSM